MTLDEYPHKRRPFSHQYYVLDNSWPLKEYALLAEMGLGKTFMTVTNLGLLWSNRKITKAIVICPKTLMKNWDREFQATWPSRWSVETHVWGGMTTEREKNSWRSLARSYEPGDGLRVFIINVDALITKRGKMGIESFFKRIPGDTACIVDESTKIKSMKAQRTKAAITIGARCQYRRILTGLPSPNNPADLYGQFAFLSGDGGRECRILGFKTPQQFEARFCNIQELKLGPRRVRAIKPGIRKGREQELQRLIDPYSMRLTKKQCLDLPDQIYKRRDVELTPEQNRAYDKLVQEVVLEHKKGLVTATNVLTKMLRFQQIVCGHLTTIQGNLIELPENRSAALMESLEEIEGKVIIWAHFRHTIDLITTKIRGVHGAETCDFIRGDVSTRNRDRIVEDFQDSKSDLRYLVAHPGTAGFGLTLTESCVQVFFSRDFSLETRLQAEDRIHRIGQDKTCVYLDLVTPDTIDENILRALRGKIQMSASVLGEDPKKWL